MRVVFISLYLVLSATIQLICLWFSFRWHERVSDTYVLSACTQCQPRLQPPHSPLKTFSYWRIDNHPIKRQKIEKHNSGASTFKISKWDAGSGRLLAW